MDEDIDIEGLILTYSVNLNDWLKEESESVWFDAGVGVELAFRNYTNELLCLIKEKRKR